MTVEPRPSHTIAVYLPPGTPDHVGEEVFEAIADLAAEADHDRPFDLRVVGLPGDPLNIATEPEA